MNEFEFLCRRITQRVCEKLRDALNIEDKYHKEPLFEMARLNRNEFGNVPFPTNKFEIKIWSNDHNPPHFHVISEGWDIAFEIETGKVLRVKKCGNQSSLYSYIVKNIPIWLDMENKAMNMTNRKFAFTSWYAIHEDD